MNTAYETVALGLRYVFIAIMAYILLRVLVLSVHDWRMLSKENKKLRASHAGEIRIIKPNSLRGEVFTLSHLTTVGRSNSCDVSIRVRGVGKKHAEMFVRDGEMYISAYSPRSNPVYVNETDIESADYLLIDGDAVQLGNLEFVVNIRISDYDEDEYADDGEYVEEDGIDDDVDDDAMQDETVSDWEDD